MARWLPAGAVGLLALALASLPVTVRAEGAIALGLPDDVARDGAAAGWAVGQPAGKAADRALQQCRTRPDVPQATRDLCRVIRVFTDACVAVALDPEDSTPGFGWAVALSAGRLPTDTETQRVQPRDSDGGGWVHEPTS